MKLLLATTNQGKRREIEGRVASLGLEVITLADAGIEPAEETGSTFEENAALKALHAARRSGLWTLAEDSGLEVDALGGRPGVYSARFAGAGATDEENNRKLLELLAEVPADRRGARFRAVMVLASPGGQTWTAEGVCEGAIAFAPRGEGGFGYDPLFLYGERTFAEMSPAEKEAVSHRGKALRAMLAVMRRALPLESLDTGRLGDV